MAAGPILVSLSPVFSKPPDCLEKVRRRETIDWIDYFVTFVAVLWLVQAAAERAPDRIRTVDGLVAELMLCCWQQRFPQFLSGSVALTRGPVTCEVRASAIAAIDKGSILKKATVNAGVNLQQFSGVKVQHGCRQEGPRYIGGLLA
jgi:hypothetical protein